MLVLQGVAEEKEEEEDEQDSPKLGIAASSIMQSIPPHVLKALEGMQAEANTLNAESKVQNSSSV